MGDALRANLASVVLAIELTDLVATPLAQTPDHAAAAALGSRPRCRLFDDLGFGCCDRLFDTLAAARGPRSTRGSTCAARVGASCGPWLAERRRRAPSGLTVVGTHLPHGGDAAITVARRRRRSASIYPTLAPDDDAALAAWLRIPAKPKALHEAKGGRS